MAIYSVGYMHGDPGYPRFFAYIALFVFSMTMLVSASNFLLLYVFWEAVGLCSYLLIGFWYREARGGRRRQEGVPGQPHRRLRLRPRHVPDLDDLRHARFPRHGDGMRPGVLGQTRARTTRASTSAAASARRSACCCSRGVRQERPVPAARLAARRDGRPDARQRPDPRGDDGHGRRLHGRPLHAAVRRFARRPSTSSPSIGGFTALLAALIALTQTDLKRVLAYSTVSQLGYMFLALGTGTLLGVTAGMFHLFTHAFFKALLFLGAGSVMHAMGGVIDMRAVRRPAARAARHASGRSSSAAWPWPASPPLCRLLEQGRDPRCAVDEQSHGRAAYVLSRCCSSRRWSRRGITAFYTFRAYFLTFYGPRADSARGRPPRPRIAAVDDAAVGHPRRCLRLA